HHFGPLRQQLLHAGGLQPAGIPAVPVINLLLDLPAGQNDLGGVDHHHVVAAVNVRREFRFVLADQHARHARGQPSQDLSVGIHHEPVIALAQRLGLFARGNIRPHRSVTPFPVETIPESTRTPLRSQRSCGTDSSERAWHGRRDELENAGGVFYPAWAGWALMPRWASAPLSISMEPLK